MDSLSVAVGSSCFTDVYFIVFSSNVTSWGSTCIDVARKLCCSGHSWREVEVSEILEKETFSANSNVDGSIIFTSDSGSAIIG